MAVLAAVAWEVSCLRSERTGRHQRPALTVMVVALAVLIILSGLIHAGGVAPLGSLGGPAVGHRHATRLLKVSAWCAPAGDRNQLIA
ncbi:hypothetical protein BZL29_8558 [Mycobacterium kansasii]|uniref:Uncharacterized protein n=1 Tax=Mycobacterium kansasii TaxID=1768 RepID=A0A1V3W981_MYCKA|nr:hypothetical protein BZL29_8558 [Mycobacterium kansasii]